MKREKHFSALSASAIAFCVAIGGIACPVTAFSLQAELGWLAIFCLVFAVAVAAVLSLRRGNLILICVLVPLGWIWWHTGALEEQVESLIYQLSAFYHSAYGWGAVYWNPLPPANPSVGLALCAMAVPVIWVTVWTVIRQKTALWAVAVGILPLCTCLVVTDKVPDTGSLFLLITGLLVLILTQTVRRQKAADGNRLTALMLIPAILCTALLFWAVPREDYKPQQALPQWMQDLLVGDWTGIGIMGEPTGAAVDLTTVGPKSRSRQEIMQVRADTGGTLYLRGQAYDTYDGKIWSVSGVDVSQDRYWPTENLEDAGQVQITTRFAGTLRYLPYYPQGTDWISQMHLGRLEGNETTTYSYQRMVPTNQTALGRSVQRDEIVQQCKELPEYTREEAKQILKGLAINPLYSDEKKAGMISEYVQNLAVYDLNAIRMPVGETDFAIWFLKNGETGYCVHFATAATVLLRAANIPARYVTGYMVEISDDDWTTVRADRSHAWVEYLDSERGWTVLDPTPAAPEPTPVTDPTDPTQTEPLPTETEPAPTESDPTLPTQSDPTAPTPITQPSGTNATTTSPVGGADTPEKRDLTVLWNCLKVVAAVAAAAAVILGQWQLRIRLRRRKLRRGTVNQRALAVWKEIVRLSRLLKRPLLEELLELAEKAKFSQHTLADPEMKLLYGRLRDLRALVNQMPWYRRILMKLLFAVE